MPLTDTTIRTAKPTEKPYKLADEKGLFLLVNPNGAKWWRLKFRVDGKEKLLSLGVYPETSLKKARADRDAARTLLAEGSRLATVLENSITTSLKILFKLLLT
jgi:hypothetical protein